MDVRVPPLVDAAARSMGLGEIRARHQCPRNGVRVFLELAAAVSLLTVVAQNAGSSQGLAGIHRSWAVIALNLIFVLPAAALLLMAAMTRLNRVLYLYSGGLVITRITGRIWRAALVFGRPGLRKPGVLVRGVGPQLRIVSCAAKLPGALDRLNAGEELDFGPVSIDSAGITDSAMTLHWPDVTMAMISFGTDLLVAGTGERKILARCKQIPDLSVLEILIAQATGTHRMPHVPPGLGLPAGERRAAQGCTYRWTIKPPRSRPA
jgi:hypothetical protein